MSCQYYFSVIQLIVGGHTTVSSLSSFFYFYFKEYFKYHNIQLNNFYLETWVHSLAKNGLKLSKSLASDLQHASCLILPQARIKGMSHHTWLIVLVIMQTSLQMNFCVKFMKPRNTCFLTVTHIISSVLASNLYH